MTFEQSMIMQDLSRQIGAFTARPKANVVDSVIPTPGVLMIMACVASFPCWYRADLYPVVLRASPPTLHYPRGSPSRHPPPWLKHPYIVHRSPTPSGPVQRDDAVTPDVSMSQRSMCIIPKLSYQIPDDQVCEQDQHSGRLTFRCWAHEPDAETV